MRFSQHDAARVRHPVRASGTLALLLLFLTIGLFAAFALEMASGFDDPVLLGVTGVATLASFLLWVRENRIAQSAANAPATPRHEIKAIVFIPLQVALAMAYVGALLAARHYVPELGGFVKGLLQSLPIGLVAGWVVVWVYILIESDEMIGRLMITATAISAGAVLCLATFWGLVTLDTTLPELGAVYLFPVFAMTHGFVAAFMIRRYS